MLVSLHSLTTFARAGRPCKAIFGLLMLGAGLLTGCGTTGDTFIPGANYDRTASGFIAAASSGDSRQLERQVNSTRGRANSQDRILYLQEHGRLLSMAGNLEESIELLQEASDRFEEERMRPDLSLSAGFFAATSLALNDLAIPYRGFSYEKIMTHNLQATNHLRIGNATFARIELNRADLEQEFAREQNLKMAERADQQARQRSINTSQAMGTLRYAWPDSGREDVRNSFQNAFTFFLSGTVFELLGDNNRAFIDYRRAMQIQPNNRTLQQRAFQVAVRENDQRQVEELLRLYPDLKNHQMPPDNNGTLVVVYEDGLIKQRDELRFPFPWQNQILQIAIPYYPSGDPQISRMSLYNQNNLLLTTEVVANLNAMAEQGLREMLPAIYIRQIMRVITKYQAQREATRSDSLLGIGVNILNLLMDKADLRAWSTLPANIQVAIHPITPDHSHLLNIRQGTFNREVQINVPPNGFAFLFVTRAGASYYVDTAVYSPGGRFMSATKTETAAR